MMFSTNVTGLINMTQAVIPIFKKRGDGGKGDIINIGSIAGREGYPGGSIYCATKAAVRTFTDAMRRELVATRIRVIEVVRGYRNRSSHDASRINVIISVEADHLQLCSRTQFMV